MQISSSTSASSRPSLLLIAMTMCEELPVTEERATEAIPWHTGRSVGCISNLLCTSGATKKKLTDNMRWFCCRMEWGQNLHHLEDMLALWPSRQYGCSSEGKSMLWHRQRRSLRLLQKCSLNSCPGTTIKTAHSALLNASFMSGIWICDLGDLDLITMRLFAQGLPGPLVLRISISHS